MGQKRQAAIWRVIGSFFLLWFWAAGAAMAAESAGLVRETVLLIAGSRDPYVSPALCREAFGTLQNPASQLAIIEGGAHAMLMEKPCYRIFRARVLAFLRE